VGTCQCLGFLSDGALGAHWAGNLWQPRDSFGGYLYDRQLVDYLRRSGDTVEIISLPWKNYVRHLGHNLNRAYFRQLLDLDVDVILQDELNHPSLVWLNRRIRKIQPAKIISIVHHLRASEQHPALLMPLYHQVERAYLHTVDGLVYNSQTTRRAVEQLVGAGKPDVVATPAGDRFGAGLTEDEILAKYQVEGRLRLLFVGNIIPRKGLHHLLNGLSGLRDLEWDLRIAGRTVDSDYLRQVKGLSTTLGLDGRVQWLGELTEAQLQTEFERAHLLTVPSTYEGFGIVYLEGMAFGLPPLATTAGAAGEIITHGVDGLLVPADNPKALAAALRPWLTDRAVLLRASLAARRKFNQFPNWEQSIQSIRNFLLHMIG
jgi:glycosyltransferase involved in cell wall biosynthesis